MKVISKLYVSDADLTSVVIPYVENQEMLKDMEVLYPVKVTLKKIKN